MPESDPRLNEPANDERPATAEPTLPQVQAPPPKHDAYAALRVPAFLWVTGSFLFAVLSSQMLAAAITWDVYDRTKDKGKLGLIALMLALPILLFSLTAGQVADSFRRKRVLLVTQVVLIAMPLTLGLLSLRGHLPFGLVCGLLLINATALTFARPTRQSLMPSLVPPAVLANAITWNSTIFEACSSIGPFFAGTVIEHFSVGVALIGSAILMSLCMVTTMFLPDLPVVGNKRSMSWASLVEGVKFVFSTRLMYSAMVLDLFAVLLGGAVYLLPVFAERLGVGPQGYGFLKAAPAVGAVSMALILAHSPPLKRAGRSLLIAVTVFGLATIVFGLSRWFWLSMTMLVICGMADNVSVVVRHTLVQSLTPDHMRGRVSAVNAVFIGSSNEIGGLESGYTAKWFGAVASVVGGGIGTILVVAGVAWRFPALRRLRKLEDVRPDAA